MELYAKRFDTSEAVRIEIADGRIAAVEIIEQTPGRVIEGRAIEKLPWVGPGLIDAQMNGYAGQEFSSDSLTVENVAKIGVQMDAFCVTRSYPTVTTNSHRAMTHSLRTIAAACRGSAVVARQFPGIHVEIPHLRTKNAVWTKLRNISDLNIVLKRTGKLGPLELKLPARTTTLLKISTKTPDKPLDMKYSATNFLVAPGKSLDVVLHVPGTAVESKKVIAVE